MADTPKPIKKIVVNRELCIGAASCVINAPGVFELDSDNKAIILQQGGLKNSGSTDRANLAEGAENDETILVAAQSCPTKAIFVYDQADQAIYP